MSAAQLASFCDPGADRHPEADLCHEADSLHDSPDCIDEATNIRVGTQVLRDRGELKTIVVFLGLFAFPLAAAREVVISGDVGSGPRMRLDVIRKAPMADAYVYLLRENGKSTPVFAGCALALARLGRRYGATKRA